MNYTCSSATGQSKLSGAPTFKFKFVAMGTPVEMEAMRGRANQAIEILKGESLDPQPACSLPPGLDPTPAPSSVGPETDTAGPVGQSIFAGSSITVEVETLARLVRGPVKDKLGPFRINPHIVEALENEGWLSRSYGWIALTPKGADQAEKLGLLRS